MQQQLRTEQQEIDKVERDRLQRGPQNASLLQAFHSPPADPQAAAIGLQSMGAVAAALGSTHVAQPDRPKTDEWNKECGYTATTAAAAAPSNSATPAAMDTTSPSKRSEPEECLIEQSSPDRAAGGDPSEERFKAWGQGKKCSNTEVLADDSIAVVVDA